MEMEDIDRVCGHCGTPAYLYEVLPEDLPKIPELPKVKSEKPSPKTPELPMHEAQVPAAAQTVVYDRPEEDRSETRLQEFQSVDEDPSEAYVPTDAQRRSRSYTIEDVPAVSAQQGSTRLIVILSIIAAVLIAIGAFIYFVFRPFDDKIQTNAAAGETEASTEYVTEV